jgi:hypothetical protein
MSGRDTLNRAKTPRCDRLKRRLPIYNDYGTMRIRTDDAEHWEMLARKLERELRSKI